MASALLVLGLAASLFSQPAATPFAPPQDWKDPSPHATRFVTVSPEVRLEVLDWGGSGTPLVLLAGGGDTAHVFDDFAPKLASDFHVYGITRRGFGRSGFAPVPGTEAFGDDVLAVLDTLALKKCVLVGHSIAGQELSSIATKHPERVTGLVYLDAAYPYAFDNGTGPSLDDFQRLRSPQAPPPSRSDLAGFSALRQYYLRVYGYTYPEAELRQQRPINADGRIGEPLDFPGVTALLTGMKKYAGIRVPALVILATPHVLGTWIETSTDPNVREQARVYTDALTRLTDRQITVVEHSAPTARLIRLRAAHHVFLSNEADVIREMRSFLRRLP